MGRAARRLDIEWSTVMETCDQCGPAVLAMKRIILPPSRKLPDGGELTYCDHCTTANMVGLLKRDALILAIEPACVPQSV